MSTTTTRTTLEMQEQPRRRSVVPGADIQAPIPATISAGSSYFPDLEGKRVLWSDLPDISSFPSTPAGAQTPAGASTPGWLTPGNATPGWQTPAGASTPGWATPKSTQARPLLSEDAYPDIGTMYSWRGVMILLITCGSQLMDNIFMTAVNLSLPAVQAEFNVSSGDLQWLLSAYTLTFGGFLLFSGVLADRYGRRQVFSIGMGVLSVWTLANGFGNSFIQLAIFRALQGIGAAMTVPSSCSDPRKPSLSPNFRFAWFDISRSTRTAHSSILTCTHLHLRLWTKCLGGAPDVPTQAPEEKK